jgi:uncharacterized protein DUF4386
MFNCDVVLAVALYVLLKPINPALALLGAFWRLGNAIVLGVSVAISLAALDFLGGAPYLTVFNADQLQAQAKFFLGMHETGSLVGLIFLWSGCGRSQLSIAQIRPYTQNTLRSLFVWSRMAFALFASDSSSPRNP